MTFIINGKETSEKKLAKLRVEIENFPSQPGLAIIIVGENPASRIYVRNKIKIAEEIGIYTRLIELPMDISPLDLISNISLLNNDSTIHGIIVQLPLPEHINNFEIISAISISKDIDGFHPLNVGMLYSGWEPLFAPCTPLGIIELLTDYFGTIAGLDVVVIGRSNIVGRPLASLLLKEDATVTICHSKTQNLKKYTGSADIVISASGKVLAFGREYFSEKSVIIDVGIGRSKDGTIAGDIVFDDVNGFVRATTKVPGGVGPMTISCLMQNLVTAYRRVMISMV